MRSLWDLTRHLTARADDNHAAPSFLPQREILFPESLENKKVKDVPWPEHTLLVDIKRGSEQLVPDGNTTIHAGDFLYVLTKTETAEDVRNLGETLRKTNRQTTSPEAGLSAKRGN